MSVDKLVDSTQLDADLTSVANAIRTKGGTSASLAFPADFVSAIAAIPSGGGGGITKETGTFTGNGTHTINFAVTAQKSPDIVCIKRSDYANLTAVTDRAHAATLGMKGYLIASTYTAASATSLANAGCRAYAASDWFDGSVVANNEIAFDTGTNKLYVRAGNNSNLWSTSLTYEYTLFFLS